MAFIARFYQTKSAAEGAYQALIDSGYRNESIAFLAPATNSNFQQNNPYSTNTSSDNSSEIAANALKAGMILGDKASHYNAYVDKGYSVVAFYPPFGRAIEAGEIVDRFNPVKLEEEQDSNRSSYVLYKDRPAPFSSLLCIPVLTTQYDTFSEFIGIKLKSENRNFMSTMSGEIKSSNFSFSKNFGLPMLSANASPLSSLIGMPVKSGKSGAQYTRSFGIKLLSKNSTPLSSFFGVPLLSGKHVANKYPSSESRKNMSNNSAPFSNLFGLNLLSSKHSFISSIFSELTASGFSLSSKFGIKLLSNNPTPLSSMLGLPMKSGKSGEEWTSSFGFPLLTKNSTPLSSMLGLPVLSDI